MARPSTKTVDHLIDDARRGNAAALDELLPLVYAELHRIAARYMNRERGVQTLQATALVHEAYVRLANDEALSFENRAHLLGIAARAMREILVDRARARGAQKRGGNDVRITLDESVDGGAAGASVGPQQVDPDVLDIHRALDKLAAIDPQQAQIVELRFFGGLTIEETAEVLQCSPATVKRDWAVARAWLYREVSGDDGTWHNRT